MKHLQGPEGRQDLHMGCWVPLDWECKCEQGARVHVHARVRQRDGVGWESETEVSAWMNWMVCWRRVGNKWGKIGPHLMQDFGGKHYSQVTL